MTGPRPWPDRPRRDRSGTPRWWHALVLELYKESGFGDQTDPATGRRHGRVVATIRTEEEES